MKIEQRAFRFPLAPGYCYVHARGLLMPDGFGLLTMQKLDISGCDVFCGIEMIQTADGGASFSAPRICETLKRRYEADGSSTVMCDATPFYHQKTGRILLTGHTAIYGADDRLLRAPRPRSTAYAIYDPVRGDFGPCRMLEMPDGDVYFSSGAGCTQINELPDGDLLIPIYYHSRQTCTNANGCSSVAVLLCAFDGQTIRVKEIGKPLHLDRPRGLGEPSIVRYQDAYFLSLRNDESGYVSRSKDGLTFETPRPLCFDDGENLGNYNTQQHWLVGGGRLYLVYTRRAGNNDHIFRHRAPLFIGEFDPHRMCVIRASEEIVVPERGARLGNFGCQSYSADTGYVFAAEWMQNDPYGWDVCAARGSDNSIFLSRIDFA